MVMTIGTPIWRGWLRLVIHVCPRIEWVKLMARCAEIIPLTLAGGGDRDAIFPVYASPQNPLVFRAVGFVAVGAGKDVVLRTIPVRRKGVTHAAVLMAPSVLITAGPPLNVRQGPVLRTVNRILVAIPTEVDEIRQIRTPAVLRFLRGAVRFICQICSQRGLVVA